MRSKSPFNTGWRFKAYEANLSLEENQARGGFTRVSLPHSVVETPFAAFSEALYEGLWLYEKTLEALAINDEEACFLTFEGVAHSAEVFVNQQCVASHQGGYTGFSVDLSPWLKKGESLLISVVVDSRESQNIPPFGHVIDYMTYGGIYREAWLEKRPKQAVQNPYALGVDLLTERPKIRLEFEMPCGTPDRLELTLRPMKCFSDDVEAGACQSWTVAFDPQSAALKREKGSQGHSCYSVDLLLDKRAVVLWSPDNPQRYQLSLGVYNQETCLDHLELKLGFRDFDFRPEGFFLNGKGFKIRGLNRHQSWPYVGYAMPKRPQVLDAAIMKTELGLNAVRTAHYPQSHYFVEACDRIGLLVFTELPGWQHIGDEAWQERALEALNELILQYRQYASVMLWGVRINESQDHEAFYRKTNDLAKVLDPYRSTGGVRYIKKSQQFEDVYTFNDFSFNNKAASLPQTKQSGTEPKKKVATRADRAYLVSEYNGHMYPTKTYDDSLHRMEHALRHAHVLNSIYRDAEIAGGFGWCLFDYNTHQDFGSGDRICHHGVLDMFRNPKLAAAVYSSQRPLSEGLVLAAASNMDIGDYPAGYIPPFPVFSNAAYLELYKNGQYVKRFDKDQRYHHALPNPPFWIDDLIGEQLTNGEGYNSATAEDIKSLLAAGAKYGPDSLPLKYKLLALKLIALKGFKLADGVRLYSKYLASWGAKTTTYTFKAFDHDGHALGAQERGPSLPASLRLTVDSLVLRPDSSYDVATVRIQSLDSHGHVLSYDMETLTLEVSGDIELIGPKHISLRGGLAGTYVKTKADGPITEPQEGQLLVSRSGAAPQTLHFTIEPIQP